MADHRQRTVFWIAVMNVALAGLGRTPGVGEVLVEMSAEVAAPNQMAGEVAVGERDDIEGFVGQQRERHDQALVALAAGDGAAEQPLAEEIENPIIDDPRKIHPRVDPLQGSRRVVLGVQRRLSLGQ